MSNSARDEYEEWKRQRESNMNPRQEDPYQFYGDPVDTSKLTIRVYDKKTKQECVIGALIPIRSRDHYGRKHIAIKGMNARAEEVTYNAGILNPDGTVEAQPGYRIEVSDDTARNIADSDEEK